MIANGASCSTKSRVILVCPDALRSQSTIGASATSDLYGIMRTYNTSSGIAELGLKFISSSWTYSFSGSNNLVLLIILNPSRATVTFNNSNYLIYSLTD